ncbi:MAG: hypothetical protein HQL31_01030 [Planctomycetes bacterium]|nr:hypothetical protein [Planctomycetota bacterium]
MIQTARRERAFFVFFTSLAAVLLSTWGLLSGKTPVAPIAPGEVHKLLVGEAYPETVGRAITGAVERVWVSMYVMKYQADRSYALENRLVEQLVLKHRQGLDVRVLLDASFEWSSDKNKKNTKADIKNEDAFKYLKKQGVPVRYDSLEQTMHSKFLVIDDLISVVGSTNWTYSALKSNVETSLLVRSAELNTELADLHSRVWKAAGEGKPCPLVESRPEKK